MSARAACFEAVAPVATDGCLAAAAAKTHALDGFHELDHRALVECLDFGNDTLVGRAHGPHGYAEAGDLEQTSRTLRAPWVTGDGIEVRLMKRADL